LIEEHYYKRDVPAVREFISGCFAQAQSETQTKSRTNQIRRINARLSRLPTSHLHLFSPSENRQIWESEALDNGIRVRKIDAAWIVIDILKESPAGEAGFRIGDELESIDGNVPSTDSEIQSASGSFRFRRAGKTRLAVVKARVLTDDLSVDIRDLDRGVGWMRIPSFLPKYFDEAAMQKMKLLIQRYRGLVIDVRGNAGGSFPAALRMISLFQCHEETVGEIWRAGRPSDSLPTTPPSTLMDDLDAGKQVELLNGSSTVKMKAWPGYGCFSGAVVVLIDSETASVAEIFAKSFKFRRQSWIWGQPSSGQVVMAQWFPVKSLGGGDFALSIPIAGYRTVEGEELENKSIEPSRELQYDKALALLGRDSWVEEAALRVSK
jgi:carboxyl-terminal processing protease